MKKIYSPFFWILSALPIFTIVAGIAFVVSLILAGSEQLLLSIAIGVVAGVLALSLLLLLAKSSIARRIKINNLDPKLDTRFQVSIDSLCLAHGFQSPKLAIIKSNQINAFAFGLTKKSCVLAITTATHKELDSVELEGVLAHELSRISLGITGRETYVTALLKIPFRNLFNGLAQKLIQTDAIIAADMNSVEMTRYPPGLIAALAKIAEQKEISGTNEMLSTTRYGKERLMALREFWEVNI